MSLYYVLLSTIVITIITIIIVCVCVIVCGKFCFLADEFRRSFSARI